MIAGSRNAAEDDDMPMTRCGSPPTKDSLETAAAGSTDAALPKKASALHLMDNLAFPFVCVVVAQGIVAFVLRGQYTNVTVCGFVFFLLLMLNTYVSLSFTDSVYRVRCLSDGVINLPLVAAYLALPWLVHKPFWFFLVLGAFFCIAMMRYANWITLVDGAFFLRRKIFANGLAGTLSLVAAAASHILESHTAAIMLIATIIFAYANIHTLWLDPLYREK